MAQESWAEKITDIGLLLVFGFFVCAQGKPQEGPNLFPSLPKPELPVEEKENSTQILRNSLTSIKAYNRSEVSQGQNRQTIHLTQKSRIGFLSLAGSGPKWVQSGLRDHFPHKFDPETHFGPSFEPLPANDEKPILDPLLCQITIQGQRSAISGRHLHWIFFPPGFCVVQWNRTKMWRTLPDFWVEKKRRILSRLWLLWFFLGSVLLQIQI